MAPGVISLLMPQTPNPSFQGTAGKLRLPVRFGLRPTPAPELKRWGSSARSHD
jgi:hypothetical protein